LSCKEKGYIQQREKAKKITAHAALAADINRRSQIMLFSNAAADNI
jgi:hypothetical protein